MSHNEHLTAGLADIWQCTTSEAAERIAPKRKRISQESLREEIPWTAARCNRLLRTITSRVNILRKQSKLCAAGSSVREARSSRDVSRSSSEDASSPKRASKSSAHDPEWVPGVETKTSSRTYGGKSKSRPKPASRKADSGFSTPFVKRLLKDAPLSAAKPWPDATRADERPKKTLQLPVQLASRNEEAQRNLVRAFDNLLTATDSGSPLDEERVGARSLMSACLRRVPDFIDLELEDQDDDDKDDENIASTIYTELESLGTNSDGGWSGLREVVRSHGLHHVLGAIDEGLIPDHRISELVDTCSRHGDLAGTDCLLHTLTRRDCSSTPGTIEDSHAALAKLIELRIAHDAPELYLRHHTNLVQSKRVNLSEILRPGSPPLKDMISGLLRGPSQDAALAYLEAAAIEDYNASKASSLPVFSRLAGLLSSLALAQTGNSASPFQPGLDLSALVNRIAATVAQMDVSAYNNQSASIAARPTAKTHPFSMASTLLQLTAQTKLPDIVTPPLNILIETIAHHQNAFVKFAVNVAQHVHRFSDADEFESLLITTSGMLGPPSECNDDNRSTLNRLAFEVAFAYSEQTGIDIDDRFRSKLATNDSGPANNVAQTPRRRVQVSGYKWEEGLCEWVAATPAAKPLIENPRTDATSSRQLLTPKEERSISSLVIPPSPLVVVPIMSPPHTDAMTPQEALPTRTALRERSANQQVPQPIEPQQEKKKQKAHGFLKPALPKQVHLKEERAKKAAALLVAQKTIQIPTPPEHVRPKRSLSLANLDSINDRTQRLSAKPDTDELGMLTPARKKSKRISAVRGARSSMRSSIGKSSRTSLPACTLDEMSEDELGL